MTNNDFHLTGGIFFYLILLVLEEPPVYRKQYSTDESKTESTYFLELVNVLSPESLKKERENPSEQSFRSLVSKYKSGKSEGSNRVPFNTELKRSQLIYQVVDNYDICYVRMKNFIYYNISITENDTITSWLKRILIELLKADNSVEDNYPLYIEKNGVPVQKRISQNR